MDLDETAAQLFREAKRLYPDSAASRVLADRLEELGLPATAARTRCLGIIFGDGDGDGDDGHGGGYGGGYGDGGDYGGDDGYGGDGGYGGGGGYGDYGKPEFCEGVIMGDGLCIITVKGGYSPYVMIGWAVRRDEFVAFRNCRVIRRFGSRAQLAVIARKGPQRDTELLEASELEWIPVGAIGRVIPADAKAWRKECPEPVVVEG